MSKKASVLILTLIMTFATLNFAYWINQKSGFHCDEIYSFGLSNKDFHYNIYDENGNIRWNNNEDIDSYMLVSENGRFDYKNVYENQISDVHPPLFYIILHTLMSFIPNEYSSFIVLLPNMLFSLGTCLFIYFIGMRLLKERFAAVIMAFCFIFSVNAINMATYIRMYAQLAFFTTAALYIHIKFYDNDFLLTKKSATALSAIIFLGAYTHYYFFIFISGVTLFTVFNIRNTKKILNYLLVIAITAIVYSLVWQAVFTHLLASDRGTEAVKNMTESSVIKNIGIYFNVLNSGLGIILSVAFIISLIISFKKIKSRNLLLIGFTSVFYLTLISKVAPYQTDRYIAPLFPMFSIMIIYFMFHTANKINKSKYTDIIILGIVISGLFQNLYTKIIKIEDIYYEENYLYRISPPDLNTRQCIFIHSHEAQFLRNLPDYKNYESTAFVHINDIEMLKETENEFTLYISNSLDSEQVIKQIEEVLGTIYIEPIKYNDNRSWSNIFILNKRNSS